MSITVAVVDDDVRILDAITMVLEAVGWRVRTYATGEAFLAEMTSGSAPHCLILDSHLPGMNGLRVVTTLYQAKSGVDIPIIVLTAYPNSSITKQIIEAGAHSLYTKPIAAEMLISQVAASINQTN